MIKNFFNELKISKLSYLLEIIEIRDFKSKIKAYNKIRKMKLSKNEGLLILDNISNKKIETDDEANIYFSLLSLLVNDFYIDYAPKIELLYKNLPDECKYDILSILSISKKEDSVYFYRDLVSKYYDGSFDLPIGTLSVNQNNYEILFPELYKTLNLKIKRNKVLLLLIDFINLGVITIDEIKNNKKYIQNAVNLVLKEGANFKTNKDTILLQDNDYFNLRIMLEAAINIEYYVSNKTSKEYLTKLLKKKDNQLKLFIFENYVKKGMDISKINLNAIAKDPLSRYPLYSFLMFYNLERLMPKKYANNISLSESDLTINYAINYAYKMIPFDFEYIDSKIINGYRYYLFKFKTNFNYDEEIQDAQTDYILKNTSLDKKISENSVTEYIGISGGFNTELDPSIVEKELPRLIIEKIDQSIDITINKIIKQLDNIEIVKKVKKKTKKKIVIKEKKEKKPLFKKVKEEKEEKEEITKKDNLTNEEKHFILVIKRIFSFNTLLFSFSIVLIILVIILLYYVNGHDILNITNGKFNKSKENSVIATAISNDNFREINYKDLFRKDEREYYVLIFKKKDVSVYYNYVNTLLDNSYVIYYIDLNDDNNKEILSYNETGFIVTEDTFIKVNDREYEFYVVGKKNILREFKLDVDLINANKKAEEEKKSES